MKFKILVLFLFVTIVSISFVSARTIVLIYDDSRSMKYKTGTNIISKNYYVYANYAAKILTALLEKGDMLIVIRMNSKDKPIKWEIGSNRQELINSIENWGSKGGCTLYKNIEKAQKEIIEANVDKDNRLNWVIIMTDGEFEKSCNTIIDKTIVTKNVEEYSKNTKGNERIVFVLIGEDAQKNKSTKIWKEIIPKQVDIVPALDEKDIIDQMEKIAYMITEKDFKSILTKSYGETIVFNTIFPLKRITVMNQETGQQPLNVKKVIYSRFQKLDNIHYERLNITKKVNEHNIKVNLEARVTHCTGDEMPTGDYVIQFDNPIKERNIKVLLETDINFKTQLFDINNNIIEIKQGKINSCYGQGFVLGTYFFKYSNGEKINFTNKMLNNLNINAYYNDKTLDMKFDKSKKIFFSNLFFINEPKSTIYMRAAYPEYFRKKSNVIVIKGKKCKPRVFTDTNIFFKVPYILSDDWAPLKQKKNVWVRYPDGRKSDKKSSEIITAYGIPPGIKLSLNNKELTTSNNKIKIPMLKNDEKLSIKVFRNKKFLNEKPKKITIDLLAQDGSSYQWKNSIIITIVPRKRKINVEQSLSKWSTELHKIPEEPVFKVHIKQDENDIPEEEFKNWKMKCVATSDDDIDDKKNNHNTLKRFPLNVIQDDLQSIFYIQPEYYLNCPCFTNTGKMKIICNYKGPFNDEKGKLYFDINIKNVSWKIKCLPLIIKILTIIFIFWFIFGIITKERFESGRYVSFKIIENRYEYKPRVTILKDKWLKRWLLPYIPEKRTIRKFTFYPGPGSNTILIRKNQTKKNVYIDGVPQNTPWNSDLLLSLNSTLTEEVGNRIESYTYE